MGGEKPELSLPPSTAELIQHKSPPKIKFQIAENKCGKFQLQGQDSRKANIKNWKRPVLDKTTTNHYKGKNQYLRAALESLILSKGGSEHLEDFISKQGAPGVISQTINHFSQVSKHTEISRNAAEKFQSLNLT